MYLHDLFLVKIFGNLELSLCERTMEATFAKLLVKNKTSNYKLAKTHKGVQ